MKIKCIRLKNIGPYINENVFDFDVSKVRKRVVLIGGKNGAGKTTLFNAIKICLYGCAAYGFSSNGAKYFAEIEKIINSGEKLKKVGTAEVNVDLLMDDGKYNHVYTFERSWKVAGSRIVEKFSVYKDHNILSETEKSDFESYLLQTLPPNLFRFYFFDGERISDFVFNGGKNSDFKDAFLKLCSLDTIEIIRENFQRISRSRNADGMEISAEYDRCLEADKILAQRVEYVEEKCREISDEIQIIDEKLAQLEKLYSKGGGISKKEWRSMQEQISKENARRDDCYRWLKDVANNVLPFIILRAQLDQLKLRIELEHKAQVGANVKSTIDTPEIRSIISGVLSRANIELADDISQKIIYEVADYASYASQIKPILNLSDFDKYELTAKINSLLVYDIGRIQAATEDIKASLQCVRRIRKKLERSSIEDYDGYLQTKSDLNEQKSSLAQHLLEIEKEVQVLRTQKATSEAKLSKARSDYETILKKRSITDISARALLAFDELQQTLYRKSIRLVEEKFSECFARMINKSDLIDGIHIDEDLNVLPYKNKCFKADEIRKTIDKNGEEYFIAQIGLYAHEAAEQKRAAGEIEFQLPIEVKQQLSAGERQIFIMALYQALSQLNHISVPYIIDTPFARIDKEHRGKILCQFFKKLKGQMIILSTDEEIVGEYYESVSSMLSNTFILNHTADGNTEICANTYFGG